MNIEKMTQQEEEIMRYVWLLGRCTVKDVVTEMPEPQPPYTTVASVINNLKRKGYVKAARKGNGYEYVPTVKEATYKQSFMSGFVHDYFKNSFQEMVSFFAKEDKITPEELKEIIREIEKGKGSDAE